MENRATGTRSLKASESVKSYYGESAVSDQESRSTWARLIVQCVDPLRIGMLGEIGPPVVPENGSHCLSDLIWVKKITQIEHTGIPLSDHLIGQTPIAVLVSGPILYRNV